MSLREFEDDSGVKWEVWDVRPTSLTSVFAPAAPSERGGHISSVGPLQESFAGGWLCFSRGDAKRRLAPIPADWHRASEVELQELCRNATEVAAAPAPHTARQETPLSDSSQQLLSALMTPEASGPRIQRS